MGTLNSILDWPEQRYTSPKRMSRRCRGAAGGVSVAEMLRAYGPPAGKGGSSKRNSPFSFAGWVVWNEGSSVRVRVRVRVTMAPPVVLPQILPPSF